MNKLTKVGLSALAGSLAVLSANAVEVTVAGDANLTYTRESGKGSLISPRGNQFGMSNNIYFTGSGEVNGMKVTYYNALSATAAISSSNLTFDMGDSGAIRFDQGGGGNGIDVLDDPTPTAYEESSDNIAALPTLAGDQATNVFNYSGTFAGFGINAMIDPRTGDTDTIEGESSGAGSTGSAHSVALTMPEMIAGLNVQVGMGTATTKDGLATAEDRESLAGSVKYTVGRATVGYNRSETSGGAATAAANYVEGLGIVVAINENLSISLAEVKNEFGKVSAAHVTETTTGIGAAYTMGGMTIAFQNNDGTNIAGVAADSNESTELSLTFAF